MLHDRVTTPDRDLAARLKHATQDLHRHAERSGVIGRMLSGSMSRDAYVLFLRNLLPAYQRLESALDAARDRATIAPFIRPELYRSAALRSDLATLAGPGWMTRLPVLPAGQDYAARIADAASIDPTILIAHTYVRYLGDLNGGRILRRRIAQTLDLEAAGLRFYAFDEIPDIQSFTSSYRHAYETIDLPEPSCLAILDEARHAFRHNIEISEAVQDATT